jgi:hypothetical protein
MRGSYNIGGSHGVASARSSKEGGNEVRERIRSHLSYANVAATLALFLVISGGTAAAVPYIVSSNSQLGPGTVSGHNPPTGKHANIIGGSVNGSDLATNAVSGGKILDGSVGQSDLSTTARGARA